MQKKIGNITENSDRKENKWTNSSQTAKNADQEEKRDTVYTVRSSTTYKGSVKGRGRGEGTA